MFFVCTDGGKRWGASMCRLLRQKDCVKVIMSNCQLKKWLLKSYFSHCSGCTHRYGQKVAIYALTPWGKKTGAKWVCPTVTAPGATNSSEWPRTVSFAFTTSVPTTNLATSGYGAVKPQQNITGCIMRWDLIGRIIILCQHAVILSALSIFITHDVISIASITE